jgi:hypothetical protein
VRVRPIIESEDAVGTATIEGIDGRAVVVDLRGSDDDEDEEEEEFKPYEWFLIPLVGYSSDIGFAGALLGQLFHYEEGFEPFRDKVQLITLLTTDLVQFHELIWERVGLFDIPLRMKLAANFTGTPVGHYCGVGNQVTCSGIDARAAAMNIGLTPDDPAHGDFVEHYYRYRILRPTLQFGLRWQPVPRGIELSGEWEGSYTLPGYIGTDGPYPGSLYEQDHPDAEEGFLSAVRIGGVIDRRDDERRPTGGWILAAHLRGAHRAIGSNWNYAGVNLSAAGYFALTRNKRLVLATRAIADLLVGDPPTVVMGSVVGFWNDTAFGGQLIGRGIRARRFIGRIKVVGQLELRLVLFGDAGAFQGVLFGFADAGWVGVDYDDFGGNLRTILTTFGGGLGVYWGQAFLLRFDAGFSPQENYVPAFYISLRHPF